MKQKTAPSFHENLSGFESVKPGSDRAFGFVFTGAFLAIALLPLLHGHPVRLWALPVAGVFLLISLIQPGILAPLNRLWFRFGLFLHKLVSPVMLGIIFFGVITPMGIILRWLGKDLLKLSRQPEAKTYWVDRTPPGPAPETMNQPF